MAEQTLGNASAPTSGFNISSQYNQVSPASNSLHTPDDFPIIVTRLYAYFGGNSGSISGCKLCIWGTGGSLLYSSQTFTVPSGRAWRELILTTKPLLQPGQNIYVGWWAPSGHSMTWGVRSSGSWQGKENQSAVSSMVGATVNDSGFEAGEAGGYLKYVPAGAFFGQDDGTPSSDVTAYIGDDDGTVVTIDHIYIGDDDGNVVQLR